MRRYPELKDSGIKWVGLMPSHWKTSKIGNLFTIKKRIAGREGYPVLSITQRGLKVKDISVNEGQMAADYSGYQFVYPGDFAMNPMDLITGYVGISSQFGVTSPAYRVFSINDSNSYSAEYYLLLLELCYRRRIFYGYGKGVASKGRWCLPVKNFNRFYVPLPPLPEQEQIARFLDWKTSDIDSLISVRQKQVEKLKELRTSVISSAVTRGLEPNATMKDSGIKWVGLMPSHWKTSKIGNLFTIKKRIAVREGYPVLSITQRGLKVKDISANEGQMAADYSGYQFVYPGDFAMNHMDLLTGYVGISSQLGVTSPDYRVFSLNDPGTCSAKYYLLILELCYKRKIFYGYGKGAATKGRWRLPASRFKVFNLPLPPLYEQEKIAKYLDTRTTEIDKLIATYEDEITRLKEFKTSLISDAVTGKIDVRGVRVPESVVQKKEALQCQQT